MSNKSVRLIVISILDINRNVNNWERIANITGEMPSDDAIFEEWKSLNSILEEARIKKLDNNSRLKASACLCVSSFMRVAPQVAGITF